MRARPVSQLTENRVPVQSEQVARKAIEASISQPGVKFIQSMSERKCIVGTTRDVPCFQRSASKHGRRRTGKAATAVAAGTGKLSRATVPFEGSWSSPRAPELSRSRGAGAPLELPMREELPAREETLTTRPTNGAAPGAPRRR